MLLDDEDEVTTPTLDLKDPMAIASRIRVNREIAAATEKAQETKIRMLCGKVTAV